MKTKFDANSSLSRRSLIGAGVVLGAVAGTAWPQLAAADAKTTAYAWRTIPFGGGGFVDGFLYHPKEKDLLYARTDVGGAYRFDAASKRWVPLQDFLSREDGDLKGVLSMAVDAQDADRLYLACGEYLGSWARDGAVLSSADRGATWSMTALPAGVKLGGNADGRGTGERLQVDPNAGHILFLGTNQNGLFRSADQAKSFSPVNFPSKNVSLVLIDATSGAVGVASQTLYAGCGDDGGGLYKSTDGGASFVPMTGLPKLIPQRAALDAEGHLYVTLSDGRAPSGGRNGALYKLDAATGKWKDMSPMRPGSGNPDFAYCGLDLDPRKPGTVVVSTMNRYAIGDDIYLSRDGGGHWTAIGPRAVHSTGKYHWMFKGLHGREQMGNWLADIKIDPFNSDSLIYGTGSGLWITSDLGNADVGKDVHFEFAVDNFEETVATAMVSPSAGATLYVSMGDVSGAGWDDITQSPSDGVFLPSWETNTSVDFAELAPQYVVRTANNAGTSGYYSSDGGLKWTPFAATPRVAKDSAGKWHGAGSIAISAGGTALLWAPEKQGGYYSKDMGKTWSPSVGWPSNLDTPVPLVADRTLDGLFYAHDRDAGTILISIDSGATFKPTITGLPRVNGWESSFLVAGHGRVRDLWLGMPEGLFHVLDEKAPMRQVKGVDEAWLLALGKAPEGKAYPATYLWGKVNGQQGLWRSDDMGESWIRINDDKHRFGGLRAMSADPLEFGTVYLAPDGRGVMVGKPA